MPCMTISRVKFVETRSDVLNVLEIDAPLDEGGRGSDAAWHTVFGVRAHITASEFRVEGSRLVQRVHLGEFDPGVRPQRVRSARPS
jgi:hypothetical protein